MSENTDKVEKIQGLMAEQLLPALRAAEQDTVLVAGETVEIPQQVKAKLKQKVNGVLVEIRTTLNQIGV